MLADLEALTPPLVVGAALLVALFLFLRRQMGPARPSDDVDGQADEEDEGAARGAGEERSAGADRACD